MNRDHHVIGNGESRKDLNVDNLNGTTYGCNAIYRDYYTDYLFNKDKPIQHEILDSECWKDRKVIDVPIDEGINTYKNVERNDSLVETALSLDIYLGDTI